MRAGFVAGIVVCAFCCSTGARADVVVVNVVVALCDVATQGVVPPPDVTMCDASKPEKNLYWGARYGVKTFLPASGWTSTPAPHGDNGAAERLRFTKKVGGKDVVVFADGYADMGAAVDAFLRAAAADADDIVVFVGHDGLMERSAPDVTAADHDVDVAVFACLSERYFGAAVEKTGARRRLLTRDFMAPEAYVVDAYIDAVVRGADVDDAVTKAYAKYQKLKRPPSKMFVVTASGEAAAR